MRRRPSVATVIATIALIVSLSGTAMATVIVTKNNQVAAHTIAGANAPPGGNKNLISGSVGTSDLHSGAVTIGKLASNSVNSSKVANGSLTGSDLKLPDVSTKLGLRFAHGLATPGNDAAFFTDNVWTLTGHCIDDGGGNTHATIEMSKTFSGSGGLLSVNGSAGERFTVTATTLLAATPSSNLTQVRGGDFSAVFLPGSSILEYPLAGRVLAGVDNEDFSVPTCVFMFNGTSG